MYNSHSAIRPFLVSHATAQSTVFRTLSSRRKFVCNYEVLGVTPSATSQQIKQAYYDKSKQYHPDLNSSPDAAYKFQQVNLAYEILSNDQMRNEYDFNRGIRGRVTRPPESNGSNGDSAQQAQFSRKMYSRLRKNAANYQNTSDFFESRQEASRAWQKIKHEQEFYDHLSAEMKEAYKEYLQRKEAEEQARKANQETYESHKKENGIFVAWAVALAIIGLLELAGRSSGMFREKGHDRNMGDARK